MVNGWNGLNNFNKKSAEEHQKELDLWKESQEKHLKVNPEDSYDYYDEVTNYYKLIFLEDSEFYKNAGALKKCDPLYINLNNNVENIEDLKVIAKFLSKDELLQRLSYDNFMILKSEVVIDSYLMDIEKKKIQTQINILESQIVDLQQKQRSLRISKTKKQEKQSLADLKAFGIDLNKVVEVQTPAFERDGLYYMVRPYYISNETVSKINNSHKFYWYPLFTTEGAPNVVSGYIIESEHIKED